MAGVSNHASILDLDPDLVPSASNVGMLNLPPVPLQTLDAGPWDPRALVSTAYFGLLVTDGLLAASTDVDGRAHTEIIGSGDILQPWISGGPAASMPDGVRWRVVREANVAVLDRRFAAATARHPILMRALMERLVLRSRRLLFQLAVLSVPQISQRIELILWHFADRWGRVTPEGTVLDLPVSHEMLAHVVASQRPSVTTALGALREGGRISRDRKGCWLLAGDPPRALLPLYEQVGMAASARQMPREL